MKCLLFTNFERAAETSGTPFSSKLASLKQFQINLVLFMSFIPTPETKSKLYLGSSLGLAFRDGFTFEFEAAFELGDEFEKVSLRAEFALVADSNLMVAMLDPELN